MKPLQLDAYSNEPIEPATVPTDTALPDAGYDATQPPIIGASKSALVLKQTPNGCVLSTVHEGREADVDDYNRKILKSMYGRRAKVIRETGTFPGTDTDQLLQQEPTDD